MLHSRNNTVATQCNLLGVPPLVLLKPDVSLDDSFTTETETEEVGLDTSLQSKRNIKIKAAQLHYILLSQG